MTIRRDIRADELHMGFQSHLELKERMSGGFQEGKGKEPLRMHFPFCRFIHLLNYSGTLLLVHSPFNKMSEHSANDAPRLHLGERQEKRCKSLRGVTENRSK